MLLTYYTLWISRRNDSMFKCQNRYLTEPFISLQRTMSVQVNYFLRYLVTIQPSYMLTVQTLLKRAAAPVKSLNWLKKLKPSSHQPLRQHSHWCIQMCITSGLWDDILTNYVLSCLILFTPNHCNLKQSCSTAMLQIKYSSVWFCAILSNLILFILILSITSLWHWQLGALCAILRGRHFAEPKITYLYSRNMHSHQKYQCCHLLSPLAVFLTRHQNGTAVDALKPGVTLPCEYSNNFSFLLTLY